MGRARLAAGLPGGYGSKCRLLVFFFLLCVCVCAQQTAKFGPEKLQIREGFARQIRL